MTRTLGSKDSKAFEQFRQWVRNNPQEYEKLLEDAYMPGLGHAESSEVLDRAFGLWKTQRKVGS